MRKVSKGNVQIKIWDIGGQPRFRAMWERYCRGVTAIVYVRVAIVCSFFGSYVVDAADHEKIEVSKKELCELLARPSLGGIPLLVLANKLDLPGALSADQLIAAMYAESVVDVLDRILSCVLGI